MANEPVAEPIDLGFSVADAEGPRLELEDETLTLHFTDWREQTVTVVFEGAIGLRWQEAEHYGAGERDDSCYVIRDSPWVREHREQDLTPDGVAVQHLKLNFNTAGVLDVICTAVRRVL